MNENYARYTPAVTLDQMSADLEAAAASSLRQAVEQCDDPVSLIGAAASIDAVMESLDARKREITAKLAALSFAGRLVA